MDITRMMKQIHEKQLEEFKHTIEDKQSICVNYYLCLFLGSFLGKECLPQTPDDFARMTSMVNEGKFVSYFNCVIDSVSLCGQEIEFFHKMVNLKNSENYIETCINAYKKIDGLERCQLGGNILKFLECSKDIDLSN